MMAAANNPVTLIKVAMGDRTLTFHGRFAQTLHDLIERGEEGVTSIERPGARIAHYIFVIRREGITIETVRVPHGGAFAGWHGLYVLREPLEVVEVKRFKEVANDA
jgi:hypothetical protein